MSTNTLSELAKLFNQSHFTAEAQEAVEASITAVVAYFRCSREQAIDRLYSLTK